MRWFRTHVRCYTTAFAHTHDAFAHAKSEFPRILEWCRFVCLTWCASFLHGTSVFLGMACCSNAFFSTRIVSFHVLCHFTSFVSLSEFSQWIISILDHFGLCNLRCVSIAPKVCPADDFRCSAMFARRFQPLALKLGKHTSHSLSEDTMEKGSLGAVAAPSNPARKTSSCRPETPVHL